MAGDWIKMRRELASDPDVIQIAALTKLDEFGVVGRLHAVWSWLDQHSVDGTNVRIVSAFLDRLSACPGFADSMRAIGWLDGRDGALSFPRYTEHNGETAKRRAVETKRKQKQRDNPRDKCPADGGTKSGTSAGPEKRREEKSTTEPTHRASEFVDDAPNEAQAIAQIAAAGIDTDFAKMVYADWHGRNGKDGAGQVVKWPYYVTKRWGREQIEWKSGRHKAKPKTEQKERTYSETKF